MNNNFGLYNFDRNELSELYKFLYKLNPNITWEPFLMEKIENIKTLFDFLKVIKYKLWVDKSISYDYIIPRGKVYEHYIELIYGEYLLKKEHSGLVVIVPNLDKCYYPDKVRKCIELKLSVLRSIINLNHLNYREIVVDDRYGKIKNITAIDGIIVGSSKNEMVNRLKDKSSDRRWSSSKDKTKNNETKEKNKGKSNGKYKQGDSIRRKSKDKSKNKSKGGISPNHNFIEDLIESKVTPIIDNFVVTFDMTLFGDPNISIHDPIYCENDRLSRRIHVIKIFCFMLSIGVDLSEIEIILRNLNYGITE